MSSPLDMPRVQIVPTAERSPAQLQAWQWLWRRLLAEDPEQDNGPEGGTPEPLAEGTAADRTMRSVHEQPQCTPR